jgi:hypothetical protein
LSWNGNHGKQGFLLKEMPKLMVFWLVLSFSKEMGISRDKIFRGLVLVLSLRFLVELWS